MRTATRRWAALVALCAAMVTGARGGRYAFYRDMRGGGGGGGGGRRAFGGEPAALEEWGAACALLDRYWGASCSGAVLAPRWALTAAHCVTPHLAYVKYNARRPRDAGGSSAPVQYLYRHPEYSVRVEDEGRGADVTRLHHDVGLVRTRGDMRLAAPPPAPPLRSLAAAADARDSIDEEVVVLGFGRTERTALGEELVAVRLTVAACERDERAWRHVACAAAGRGEPRGVCAGDSGGPALRGGALVAVTSMGPLECAAGSGPREAATTVLTALRPYARLLNDTIREAEGALRMAPVEAAAPPARRPSPLAGGAPLVALAAALRLR